MRFTQDHTSSVNVIRSYAPGELRVNEDTFQTAVIIGASAIRTESAIISVADLRDSQVDHVLALDPELVLSARERGRYVRPRHWGSIPEVGIGFEVMDTGAACRTFNVLVSANNAGSSRCSVV